MPENTKTPIEDIWVNTTHTVMPRMGDYASVSAQSIDQFAKALFAKFEQELCIAQNSYDDDHLNGLIQSARDQVFPNNQDDIPQTGDRPHSQGARKMSKSTLKMIFDAADAHGELSGESDHAVGDLQDLLKEAWKIMSVEQKEALLRSDAMDNLIECGAEEKFDADDLVESMKSESNSSEPDRPRG